MQWSSRADLSASHRVLSETLSRVKQVVCPHSQHDGRKTRRKFAQGSIKHSTAFSGTCTEEWRFTWPKKRGGTFPGKKRDLAHPATAAFTLTRKQAKLFTLHVCAYCLFSAKRQLAMHFTASISTSAFL